MESVFMTRTSCRLSSPPPHQPFYCPTQNRTLTTDEKNICLSPAGPRPLPNVPSESHSNETTPTTHWHLQSVHRGEGGEDGAGESSLSSQYNESWQTTSTTETSGRREGGGGEEGEGEISPSSGVDGATGQCAIAKYIDRFRTAPPTPREERRKPQLGGTQNFWWQAPLQNSPSGPPAASPSPPLSHSTPTSTSSSPSSAAVDESRQCSLDNSESSASSLEERSQQALQRSSSLLASGSSGSMLTHSHPHTAPRALGKQTATSLPPPSSLPCGGGGGKGDEEEDILHQWRLRRRLEQARRHTVRLTGQLSGSGPPLFTARPVGTVSGVGGGVARGVGLPAAREGQSGRGYVLPGPTKNGLPIHSTECVTDHHSTDHPPPTNSTCRQCGQPAMQNTVPPLTHHHSPRSSGARPLSRASRHFCHTAQPLCHPVPPDQCHTPAVPPHRHTVCDVVPCALCGPTHTLTAQERGRRRRRREGREDNTRERRQSETGTSHNVQESEQRVERSLQRSQPQQRDETQDSNPPSSPPPTSAPRPPVQYPSPSLLDHMRRSSRSHGDHHAKPHPLNEAEDEVSLSLSETVFDSDGPSTPANFEPLSSPKSGIGELVSQAVRQHLFQPGDSADESIVLTAGAVEGGYDDLGDGLLRALIARARALEQQMRQIHTLLSAVEES